MQFETPVAFFNVPDINSLEQLKAFAENNIRKAITQGVHPPIFFGKLESGLIILADFTKALEHGAAFPIIVRSTVKTLIKDQKIFMGCMIVETRAVRLKQDHPDYNKILNGEIKISDHPDMHDQVFVALQRPGVYNLSIYKIVKNSLGDRFLGEPERFPDIKQNEKWFFYDDHIVN